MNGYLLDTHALIWWWTDPSPIGKQALEILQRGEATVFVSPASVWEIANKVRLGKLDEIEDFVNSYAPLMAANGFKTLSISDAHAMLAGQLEGKHRDPFDRMIAAQSLIADVTVLTRDPEISGFGCKVIW